MVIRLQCRNRAATNISGSPLQYLSQNILTNSYFHNLEYQYSSRISVNSNIILIGPFSEADHPGKIMSKKSQTKIGWHAWKEVVLATRRARTVSTLFHPHRWETFWLGNRNPYFDELHIERKLETEIKQQLLPIVSSSPSSWSWVWGRGEKPVWEKVGVRGHYNLQSCLVHNSFTPEHTMLNTLTHFHMDTVPHTIYSTFHFKLFIGPK